MIPTRVKGLLLRRDHASAMWRSGFIGRRGILGHLPFLDYVRNH
jgi:hypothetical protein